MRTVSLSLVVSASATQMWSAVTSPIGFRFISRGLVRWPIAARRTEPWREGETVTGWMFAAGIVPVAHHTLTFVRLDDATREFRTDERGGVIRRWNHSITVTPVDDSHSRIDDSVTFSGGLLTAPLALAVRVFYIIRRPRWIALARAIVAGTVRV